MGLFIKKPFAALEVEANESGSKTLKRVLGPWGLIALGVGAIIGAGHFCCFTENGNSTSLITIVNTIIAIPKF